MIWDLGLAFEFFHVFLGVAKSSLKAHHLRLQIDNSAQTKRTSSKVCNILQGCMAHRFPIWYTMPNYQLWAPQAWSNPVVDVVNEGEFRATPGGPVQVVEKCWIAEWSGGYWEYYSEGSYWDWGSEVIIEGRGLQQRL